MNAARANTDFFGQPESNPDASAMQPRFAMPRSMPGGLRFARWHFRLLLKSVAAKHEALLRVAFP
ncbi:MAG: hypothetical protein DME22_16785 [Verrucomicrobia bacterium]|nr:MAG: hypothetical protein DME22_16785 [Verrucomicrobiota bacterium]